jgi:propionate CoA-transferase
LKIAVENGGLTILNEGAHRKFLPDVEQVTFSGTRAARLGQPVIYVTERCVFELTRNGLKLTEIAPGIELDRDILALMETPPIIEDLALMDARIFLLAEMDLRVDLLHLDLPMRVALDTTQNRLFLNFEKMRIKSEVDVKRVYEAVEGVCARHPQRVDVIVNYDDCRIGDDVVNAWARMVTTLEKKYYNKITRYAGSAFMRLKLSEAFPAHRLHIYETRSQASRYLEGD